MIEVWILMIDNEIVLETPGAAQCSVITAELRQRASKLTLSSGIGELSLQDILH